MLIKMTILNHVRNLNYLCCKITALLVVLATACTLICMEPAKAATRINKLKLMMDGEGGFYVPSHNTAQYISFSKGMKGYIVTNIKASGIKEKPIIKAKSNKPKLVKIKTCVRDWAATDWDSPRNAVEYTAKKKIENTTITFTVTTKGKNGKMLKEKIKVHFSD